MNITNTRLMRSALPLALLTLTACGGGGGGGSTGVGATVPEIATWAYLDSTTINGINKNVA